MGSKKVGLISGITGQDGSTLAELLLEKGYEVHGIVRRSSTPNTLNIDHIKDKLTLHYGDITDGPSIINIVSDVCPDEVYHLAAQSHVRVSFDNPVYTTAANCSGTMNVLEACRILSKSKEVRIYNAATSEMFGDVLETPQKESTPFNPQSPYGCSKVCAFYQAVNYRRSYNMFVSNGILYNHEGPRRGVEFVTRKITLGACKIKMGLQDKLYMGNMDAYRDFGYSRDYMEAAWLMLQHYEPDDFVIATGETHTIQEFADLAFRELGLLSDDHIIIDPKFYRPSEVNLLLGDASKAKQLLGWAPKVKFNELISLMIDSDLKLVQQYANNY